MRKRLFAGLLTLVMIVSLVPMSALAVEDEPEVVPCTVTEGCTLADGHDGDCVLPDEPEDGDSNGYYEFEDVTDGEDAIMLTTGDEDIATTDILAAGGELVSGTYKLTKDVNLTADLTIPASAEVTIDLNSYTLTGSGSDSVITVYGTLTIKDSGTTGKITGGQGPSADTDGRSAGGGGIYVAEGATLTLAGGTITKNKATHGGGIRVDGTLYMTGGKITENEATYGGGIYSNSATTGAITMSDGEISKNKATYGGGVRAGGVSFTMSGGTISENQITGTSGQGGGVQAFRAFTMTGGEISKNTGASLGGGVFVQAAIGSFTMEGGTVSENTATSTGGGVYTAGTFTMSDGTISKNTANANGGGVDCAGGTMSMSGGSITENTANTNGGGVRAGGTSFTMTGGKISKNTATNGYGGGIWAVKPVTMSAGEITENKASTYGGGIYIQATSGQFSMSGGNVQNNEVTASNVTKRGGGIYVATNGALHLKGNPVVSANKVSNNTEENVYLPANVAITLDGNLSGALVGVTTANDPYINQNRQVTIAETNSDYYISSSQCFLSDLGTKEISNTSYTIVSQANSSSKYVELTCSNDTYVKITLELSNITTTGGIVTQIKSGQPYSTAISANTGYSLPEHITSPENGVTYNKNDQTNVASISISNVTQNTKITLSGVANTYTVAFVANGGSGDTMSSQSMTYDTAATLTENTYTKAGYNFAGWSTTADGSCQYPDKASVKNLTAENGATVTLYAVWTAKEVISKFDDTNAAQSYTYDGFQKSYVLTSEIEGFNITYKQGEDTETEPTKVGTYDVVISRDEDDTYAAFTQTISGGLVITAADYPVSITANGEISLSITGSGSVTLTATSTVSGITVSGVTCSDDTIEVKQNSDGTYSATLPNTTKTYTFTATVDGDTSNYGDGPATCTVSVTYKSYGGGGSSSGGSTSYTVTVDSTKNGTVSVSPKNASKGTTVTVTVKPNSGYELDDLTVTDKNG
ncbi:MAG: hypothetical protein DBX97_00110, partial [Collinsella tanakaei]